MDDYTRLDSLRRILRAVKPGTRDRITVLRRPHYNPLGFDWLAFDVSRHDVTRSADTVCELLKSARGETRAFELRLSQPALRPLHARAAAGSPGERLLTVLPDVVRALLVPSVVVRAGADDGLAPYGRRVETRGHARIQANALWLLAITGRRAGLMGGRQTFDCALDIEDLYEWGWHMSDDAGRREILRLIASGRGTLMPTFFLRIAVLRGEPLQPDGNGHLPRLPVPAEVWATVLRVCPRAMELLGSLSIERTA